MTVETTDLSQIHSRLKCEADLLEKVDNIEWSLFKKNAH